MWFSEIDYSVTLSLNIAAKHVDVLYDSVCIGVGFEVLAGKCGTRGAKDGNLLSARFNKPVDMCKEQQGSCHRTTLQIRS